MQRSTITQPESLDCRSPLAREPYIKIKSENYLLQYYNTNTNLKHGQQSNAITVTQLITSSARSKTLMDAR